MHLQPLWTWLDFNAQQSGHGALNIPNFSGIEEILPDNAAQGPGYIMDPLRTKQLTIRQFTKGDPMDAHCYPVDRINMSCDYFPELATRYYSEYPVRRCGWFAVIKNATGEIIGRVGLINRSDLFMPAEIELAYAIRERDRGNGFATEAARELVRFAKETLGLPRFFAGVHVDNQASARIAEKCGLTKEGITVWFGQPHAMYWYRTSMKT